MSFATNIITERFFDNYKMGQRHYEEHLSIVLEIDSFDMENQKDPKYRALPDWISRISNIVIGRVQISIVVNLHTVPYVRSHGSLFLFLQ